MVEYNQVTLEERYVNIFSYQNTNLIYWLGNRPVFLLYGKVVNRQIVKVKNEYDERR